jgi:hypothetical protein
LNKLIIEFNGPSGVGKSFICKKIRDVFSLDENMTKEIDPRVKKTLKYRFKVIKIFFHALLLALIFKPKSLKCLYQSSRIIYGHKKMWLNIEYCHGLILIEEGVAQKTLGIVMRSKRHEMFRVYNNLKKERKSDVNTIFIDAEINEIYQRRVSRNAKQDKYRRSIICVKKDIELFSKVKDFIFSTEANVFTFQNNNNIDLINTCRKIEEIINNSIRVNGN